MPITLLIALFGKIGVSERFRRIAAWIALVIAVCAILGAGWAILKASIIKDHEQERAVQSIEARDKASEERASDAIRDSQNERDRNDAINAAPTGGALSPAEHALQCERLRKLGRIPPACQ